MTTLNIEGRTVKVSDDFLSMTPEQQNATVDEIAQSLRISAQPKREGMMPNVNRGIADAAGGLVDFINPFDEPHSLNPFPSGTGSAKTGIKRGMEAIGIDVAENEPQTMGESFARGSGEAAAALFPVAKGLQALKGAGGAVGQFADDAYRALASYVGVGSEVVAGGVSEAARDATREAGGNELTQNLVGMLAPMSIPAAGAAVKGAAGLAGEVSLVGTAARGAAAAVAPYTKMGAKGVATRRMKELAGGEERAAELAARIGGENPLKLTPAQQTGDPNMMGIEALAAEEPNLRVALDNRRTATSEAMRSEFEGAGGDVADAQAFFRQRRAQFKADLEGRVDEALKAADTRLSAIRSRQAESDLSKDAVRAIDNAYSEARLEERDLWAAIDRNTEVPTGRAKQAAETAIAETPFAQRFDIPRAVRDIVENPEVYGDAATVREMHGAYSELRQVSRAERAKPEPNNNLIRIADTVAEAILEDMGAFDGSSVVGRQINEARAFSAQMHEVFDQGAVGRITQRKRSGENRVEPEAALDATVGRGGSQGVADAARISRAGGDPADYAVEQYLASQFNARAFKPTGEFSEAGAKSWLANNRELVARFPSLRKEIDGAVGQRVSAEELSRRVATRIKAAENERLSAMARFTGGQAEQAIRAVFDAQNPTRAARSLVNAARKDTSGKALAGLKAVFSDHLIKSAMKTRGSELTADANALNAALNDPKTASAMRQIFTSEEISRFRYVARELAKSQTEPANVGRSVSGATPPRWLQMAAQIAGAKFGTQMAGGNAGVSLQAAALGSNRVRDMVQRLTADRASQMITDAITDPDLFKALLTQTGSVQSEKRVIPYLLPYIIGGAGAGADEASEAVEGRTQWIIGGVPIQDAE